jgi:biopolymer transport protein ExbD
MNLRPKKRAVPQIPIVSLIDIMVILLIFFIATTTFRQTKTHMQVALPQSKGVGSSNSAEDSRLGITITKEQKVYLAGEETALEQLGTRLADLLKARPEARFELEADTEANLGVLVQVWDSLREAGIRINDVPARIQRIGE